MPNGKPGDHPLTDILVHRLAVYGDEADDLIRKIAELCSRRELDEWWQSEIGWSPERHLVINKVRMRLDELLQRAKDSDGRPSNSLPEPPSCPPPDKRSYRKLAHHRNSMLYPENPFVQQSYSLESRY